MDLQEFVRIYFGIFMICSPFTAISAFLSLTEGRTSVQRKKVGMVSCLTVAIVLVGVNWVGDSVMNLFGVRLATFQVAGGIILFSLALTMLQGGISSSKNSPKEIQELKKDPVGIIPLAIPLMAGPGAISSVILIREDHPGLLNFMYVSLSLLLVAASLYFCLYFASFLEKKIGKTGLKLLNNIGGLIIALIAVDVFSRGILEIFPGLRG